MYRSKEDYRSNQLDILNDCMVWITDEFVVAGLILAIYFCLVQCILEMPILSDS
jgi:hypothetical protein